MRYAPLVANLLDVRGHFTLRDQPSSFKHDLAIASNIVGGGQVIDAAIGLAGVIPVQQYGIVHAVLRHKPRDAGKGRIVFRDADDGETLGSVLLLQINQPGHFYLAGRAPGGPEVDENGLTFVIRQRGSFAIGHLQRKGRSQLATQVGQALSLRRIRVNRSSVGRVARRGSTAFRRRRTVRHQGNMIGRHGCRFLLGSFVLAEGNHARPEHQRDADDQNQNYDCISLHRTPRFMRRFNSAPVTEKFTVFRDMRRNSEAGTRLRAGRREAILIGK